MRESVNIIPDNEEQEIDVSEENFTLIYGDMLKSVYDKNNNGIVDKATADGNGNVINTTYATKVNVDALTNRVAGLENIIDKINNPTYTTTEGTNLTITNARVGNINFEFYGNTSQSGTPTPTNPVPVQSVTGANIITISDGASASQTFDLNLGKNLLENKNKNVVSNGITFTLNNDGSILVNGTATGNATYYFGVNNGSYLQKIDKTKTYSLSIGKNTFPFQAFLRISDSNNSNLFKQCQNAYGTNSNKVENIAGSFFESGVIIAQLFIYSGAVCNNFRVYPQLEIGATASDYAPNILPIELNKIGDNQDYLYSTGGKWFKHNAVGKVILNGSETWTTWTLNSSTDDYYEFIRYGLTPVAVSGYVNAITDYFSNQTANRCLTNGQTMYIRVPSSASITTADSFTTWLTSHNVQVYYKLATPIEEEITDLVTLNCLNNIKYGAKSYYRTTNITITSTELQPTMKVQTIDKIV